MGFKLRGSGGSGCEQEADTSGAGGDGGGGAPPPSSPSRSPSSPASTDEEEEQRIAPLVKSLNITHLNSTYPKYSSQPLDDFVGNDENAGFFKKKSKLGHKEHILTLLDDFDNNIFTEKIMLLHKKYGSFTRADRDGSCFYRAFIFNYLENVVEIQDEDERRTEAARLRHCVEKPMRACLLGSFGMPQAQFQRAFSGFEDVVSLVEEGLVAGDLYQMDMKDDITSRLLPLVRSLIEIEICTQDLYQSFLIPGEGYDSIFEFCRHEVRPEDREANHMQIMALVNALGIPLTVENLDISQSQGGAVKLNQHNFYPSPESEAEALELQSIDSDDSTTSQAQGEHDGPRNLSPAERRVTLLYTPGHYDILYPN